MNAPEWLCLPRPSRAPGTSMSSFGQYQPAEGSKGALSSLPAHCPHPLPPFCKNRAGHQDREPLWVKISRFFSSVNFNPELAGCSGLLCNQHNHTSWGNTRGERSGLGRLWSKKSVCGREDCSFPQHIPHATWKHAMTVGSTHCCFMQPLKCLT